ncbi:hypothetical protein CSB45_10820 [candidate division KSB3 bacterium]|uniref:FHA domain-containing protein n=1 Tax=candidate division KSB3 bacterium TaxID=2044937 RepID=A0A2G6E362_9BACT|nr:MAG: hypothetical protein CSB45_10820 [candidate division KSB3 bacterium]PIE29094.1 MAG: hypothetical protein CSA57_10785 [candidate division KSB3 bacterium]
MGYGMMLFGKKKQLVREPVFKLSSRELAKSSYEIGLLMWEKGLRERFLQERAVAVVQRQEDETRDSVFYRLSNEIDLFLGVELSKKIRRTHKSIQDIIRALNDTYLQLVEGHAEFDPADHREGLIVNLLPSFKLKALQFSVRLKERVPDDAFIIGRIVESGPESMGSELECLNHQQEYIVGSNEMSVDYYIPALADEHFGISLQNGNFFLYHTSKEKIASTELFQSENEKIAIGRHYQLLQDKDYIVAHYGDKTKRFQFMVPRELSDDGDPPSRYRLVETGYYILRRPDAVKKMYHYPTIFFAEQESVITGLKDAQYIPLPGIRNIGTPARMSYKDGEYYFRKLHTMIPLPIKVNSEELTDDSEVQLSGDNDKLEIGSIQFFYDKLGKREDVPLAIVEVSTPGRRSRRYPLFRKTLIVSGLSKRPSHANYLFLDEPSLPHNAMRLSITDGVLYIERGKDAPPLYIRDQQVTKKHPLASGDSFSMGDVQIKVARKDLPPSYYARLTLSAESKRPVHSLQGISRGKSYTLGRIEPDDPNENFLMVSEDLHVSGSHVLLSLTAGRVAAIKNISQSNSTFIISADGLLRADLPQVRPELPRDSLPSEMLLRWDRLIIGPVELEYRGPGSSIVIPDSYDV